MSQSRNPCPPTRRDRRHVPARARVAPAASLLVLALLLVSPTARAHPPKREVRAVWITTTSALDWPRTYSREHQRDLLRAMVKYLHAVNFNTIYFQVRARGDAFYRSRYEPWSDQLTGTLGLDPGWDPLATLLEEAHSAGMEVHAWFNLFKVRGLEAVRPSVPLHPSLAHPGWCVTYEDEVWMDPGNPGVRSYLLGVALDLVRSYPLDGIHFDFIRYPGRDFPDETTYRGFGRGMERDAWRRSSIDAFVRAFYDSARALRPMLKVGSAPLGVYDRAMDAGYSGSVVSHYQDALGWLRQGIHDYLAPQLYWNIGASRGDPDFASLIASWAARSGGRTIVAGIAAYKPDVAREIPQQIDATRRAGAGGEAFFRFAFVTAPGLFGGRYDTPALIPPMAWKDSIPPLQPAGLGVTEIATNVFQVEWKPSPAASDGDSARSYVVYRSSAAEVDTEDPRTIVAILPATITHLIDTVEVPEGFTYTYAVTALDKGNNESPPSVPSSATVAELLALKRKVVDFTSLSTAIPRGSTRPTLAAYRLARRMPITLQVYRREGESSETLISTLVDSVQEGGTYVLGLAQVPFHPGSYVVRLTSGDARLEQSVIIPD
jgi:uncharacterized lipoprotein YddW (UPF0748 family)